MTDPNVTAQTLLVIDADNERMEQAVDLAYHDMAGEFRLPIHYCDDPEALVWYERGILSRAYEKFQRLI